MCVRVSDVKCVWFHICMVSIYLYYYLFFSPFPYFCLPFGFMIYCRNWYFSSKNWLRWFMTWTKKKVPPFFSFVNFLLFLCVFFFFSSSNTNPHNTPRRMREWNSDERRKREKKEVTEWIYYEFHRNWIYNIQYMRILSLSHW